MEIKARVLLVLSQDVLDRARVVAGKATTVFKLPVSLQIVLRALIEEGLKREDSALLANIEGQAQTVRDIRRAARQGSDARAPRDLAAGKPAGAGRSRARATWR